MNFFRREMRGRGGCADCPSMSHPSFPSASGFTLLEVLISLALLAIILGAVYSTFFLSERAVEATDESLLKLRECRTLLDTISREAESIPPVIPNREGPLFKLEDRDMYGKTTSRLVFRSFSPLLPGLSVISYHVRKEGDGPLVLVKKLERADRPANSDDEGVDLIEDIDSFTVEARNADIWVKTWDAADIGKIPDEIRITITLKIKGKPITLYETVSPKTGKAI